MNYVLRHGEAKVPPGLGVDGFLHIVKSLLLSLTRLQHITIDHTGRIVYAWHAPEEAELSPLAFDFADVQPYNIVRNSIVEDVLCDDDCSPVLRVYTLFHRAALERFSPVGIVTGKNPQWLDEYERALGFMRHHGHASPTTLYGLPVYKDEQCPDHVVLLCASYGRAGVLSDTYKCYKTHVLPERSP